MVSSITPAETFAELHEQLGLVPLSRIRLHPPPGMATVDDVARLCDREPKRLCELVDGVLVEKVMGHEESRLAMRLGYLVCNYLEDHDIGVVAGSDGPHRILADQVRFPDVAFISYDDLPPDADPHTKVPAWVPTLAVEVISESNTIGEMSRKLRDYFEAGVALVWYVDPPTRSVRVYRSLTDCVTLGENDELDGGTVLPGLRISIRDWFERALRVRRPDA